MQGQEQQGPYTLSQLQSMWRNGSVTARTLYWQQGMEQWEPLSMLADCLEPPQQARSYPAALNAPTAPKRESRKSRFSILRVILILVGVIGLLYSIPNIAGMIVFGILILLAAIAK